MYCTVSFYQKKAQTFWQVWWVTESSDGDRWDGLASRGDDGGERERSILGIDRIVQRRSRLH